MEEMECLAKNILVFSDIYQLHTFCDSIQFQYVGTATYGS